MPMEPGPGTTVMTVLEQRCRAEEAPAGARPAGHGLLPHLGHGGGRHHRRDRRRRRQTFTWLVVLFVTFFIPSALISAELGAAIPEEGGAYVWVRRAFGRYAGALTSLLYWAGTPMWLGGSVAVVAMAVYQQFLGGLSLAGMYLFGAVFIGLATVGAIIPLRLGKWVPTSGAIGQIVLLAFFTVSVVLYGARHGVHGISAATSAPPGRCSSPSSRCCCTRSSGSSCPRPLRRR